MLVVQVTFHCLGLMKLQLEYKIAAGASKDITHILYQSSIRFTSQLKKSSISRVLQKLLSYFHYTIISTILVLSLPAWTVISYLNLNESVALSLLLSTIASILSNTGSSFLY